MALWGRQLIFDQFQRLQELGDRAGSAGDLGMGGELDKVLQVHTGPVQYRADLQATGFTQPRAEFCAAGGRRHARE